MFTHCHRKFNSYNCWFLFDNKDFTNRKLYIGICPDCGACIVRLVETRKYDNMIFSRYFYKKEAEKVIQKQSSQINYTSKDIQKFKKTPFGLCYGENKEIRNHNGEITEIRQKRCDYFGTKEVIVRIKPSYSS